MIVMNVIYKCKPGMREAFFARIQAEGIDAASRAEAANIAYGYFIPYEDSDDLLLIEKWRDTEAQNEHRRTEHFLRLRELKPLYVDDTLIDRFEV